MNSNMRCGVNWHWSLVLAPIAALLLTACGSSEAKNPAQEAALKPVTVLSALAEERLLPDSVDVTGTLMADAQTEVAAEIDGRIVQVKVERGMVVSTGMELAQLNQEDAANQLREAEANVAQTQARLGLGPDRPFDPRETPDARKARVALDRAEAEHRRYASLVEQGAVSRSEYDLKRADHLSAKEQVEATINEARQTYETLQAQKARAAMARKALGDTVIRAPYGGLIAEKHVNVGNYVKKGTRIATLVRVDPLRVELSVPESAVPTVKKGQKVAFTVQAYPGRPFEGRIAYVGPALRTDSRALVVEALVPNASGALQPGLFATARIELPASRPAAFVPASAVRTEAGVSRLFVVANDRAELRFVQLGREANGLVEVLRGVKPGERVATGGLDQLADGAPVTAETRDGR